MRRVVFMVLDGVGAGALPDAAAYGDAGANTLGNLSEIVRLRLPYLEQMGLGNIIPIQGVPSVAEPSCLAGRLAPLSAGKDTTVGHWEHMGLVTATPFPTYPGGFPEEIVRAFEEGIGRRILGNTPASGTAIIAELGEEHLATGRPIVYTSADSVFQIAAHVEVVPLQQLYEWSEFARGLLRSPHAVARVIARPFTGPAGAFVRTKDRRDFSLAPPGPTQLDVLRQAGIPVLALGKISEIFAGRGVSTSLKVGGNDENLALVQDLLRGRSDRARFDHGLLFTNLVDFDMAWGHRNDVDGFARGLAAVDAALPEIVAALGPQDLLIVTADHGVDPTTTSTDHSREYVPLLLYPRPEAAPAQVYEGRFGDTGATLHEHLTGLPPHPARNHLQGMPIQRLTPPRGWRHYTPSRPHWSAPSLVVPARMGEAEVREAATGLAATLGPAPDVAIILGSGLLPDVGPVLAEMPYSSIPHWPLGAVPGHPYSLVLTTVDGVRIGLLRGRVHEYEGFDLSDAQLAVKTMAAWGTPRLILSSASGAVAHELSAGEVVLITEVLDFHYPHSDGRPSRLPGTDWLPAAHLRAARPDAAAAPTPPSPTVAAPPPLRTGVHASLPGPQYETPAELELLRTLGVATVSMSPAAELRAAHECGLEVAVIAVVANAGDTTHEQVLAGTARAGAALSSLIRAVLNAWKVSQP